tara:strand:- start:846 stop:1085 length:240 start_codon:yes stop_codon:yes gene_type:complete
MIDAKIIRQVLDKFLKADTVKQARMQVMTLDGVFHDIKSIKLMENKIIGNRESHRIVIEVIPEHAPMGKVVKDLGGIIV